MCCLLKCKCSADFSNSLTLKNIRLKNNLHISQINLNIFDLLKQFNCMGGKSILFNVLKKSYFATCL